LKVKSLSVVIACVVLLSAASVCHAQVSVSVGGGAVGVSVGTPAAKICPAPIVVAPAAVLVAPAPPVVYLPPPYVDHFYGPHYRGRWDVHARHDESHRNRDVHREHG
jgi:hypothetical protein